MQTKVSLERCETYDMVRIKSALRRAVDGLGGLDPFVRKGERVLLKVNLLMKKRPEEAVTTHPAFVSALAELLLEHGCSVVIGDSPGGMFSARLLKGLYKTTGMEDAAVLTGATLNFNVGEFEKDNPKGLILKKLTLTDMLNDVDKVVSVSKLKTHGMMTFTGAVKNLFGIIPGTIKMEYHMNMHDYNDFANALLDICLCGAPVLSFMDGIDGMEGNGPSSGTVRHVGAIIASSSPYHLDKAACALIGLSPELVPTVAMSVERGLCAKDMDDIIICGEQLESFGLAPFKIPDTNTFGLEKLPRFANTLLNKFLQPKLVIDTDVCIGCGVCADNCPAKIIYMWDGKPVINKTRCIRCYCCQELCPKRCVSARRPWLLRMITKH